jgi:hypothetical protein
MPRGAPTDWRTGAIAKTIREHEFASTGGPALLLLRSRAVALRPRLAAGVPFTFAVMRNLPVECNNRDWVHISD